MPAPYTVQEVATALDESARRAGLRFQRIEVLADETRRTWVVRIVGEDEVTYQHLFPFSSARGVYTPAEIADHAIGGRWPFG